MKKIIPLAIIIIITASGIGSSVYGMNDTETREKQIFLYEQFMKIENKYHAIIDEYEMKSYDISWTKHIIDNNFDYAFGIHAVDVDLDGDCDVLGAAQEGDCIAWWRNEGGNPLNWTKFIIDDEFDGATSIFAVDLDGDSDIDMVGSASYANEIAVWINEGDTPVSWRKYVIKTGFNYAHEVYCYDLDEDGDIDILGSASESHQITWWKNNGGDPIVWTEQIIGDMFLGAKSARIADINNDGLLDVIGAAIEDNQICWWRNTGGDPILWEENVIIDDFTGAHRVEVCDLDFDGDIDVVGTAIFGDEISWFRNDGGTPIKWEKQVIVSGFNKACIGLPVDIDEDGDIDVIGTAIYGHDVALFRNDGGEPIVWTKIMIDTFFQGAWPGYIADLDNDGDKDIVVGASFADTVAWWESNLHQQPSKPERPNGPTEGKSGIEYTYETSSIDPCGKQLFYIWNWGDGNLSEWIGPYNSGEVHRIKNIWVDQGSYEIKVKAKNIDGGESDWSDTLSVTLSKNKPYINTLIPNCLKNHPIFYKLIQRLLKL